MTSGGSWDLEERVSLYADDMLLYLGDPELSLSNAFNVIQEFGNFSGFRIDWSKSSLFPLDPQPNLVLPTQCPLAITNQLKYLGIQIQLPYLK